MLAAATVKSRSAFHVTFFTSRMMLDKVEDTLWGLANQSMDREMRDLYIRVKDLALAERKRIESQFRINYLTEFENRVRRERTT